MKGNKRNISTEEVLDTDYNSEVPKHLKKKKSSVSKSKEKSKHKHEYVDCLLIEDDILPHKAVYCKICGKVGDIKFCETEKTDHGTYRMLNKEEIFEKYKELLQIHVKDIFEKYIPVEP